jgi:SpoVK/Ycf46/Vps4 family AAA+-type ATPase
VIAKVYKASRRQPESKYDIEYDDNDREICKLEADIVFSDSDEGRAILAKQEEEDRQQEEEDDEGGDVLADATNRDGGADAAAKKSSALKANRRAAKISSRVAGSGAAGSSAGGIYATFIAELAKKAEQLKKEGPRGSSSSVPIAVDAADGEQTGNGDDEEEECVSEVKGKLIPRFLPDPPPSDWPVADKVRSVSDALARKFKLATVPQPSPGRSVIFDWGVKVRDVGEKGAGSTFFCCATQKCFDSSMLGRQGVKMGTGTSKATDHLSNRHGIVGERSKKRNFAKSETEEMEAARKKAKLETTTAQDLKRHFFLLYTLAVIVMSWAFCWAENMHMRQLLAEIEGFPAISSKRLRRTIVEVYLWMTGNVR